MVAITPFLADRFPVIVMIASVSWTERLGTWLAQLWQSFTEWASQPRLSHNGRPPAPNLDMEITGTNNGLPTDVVAAAFAWLITFCLVCIIILGLGFGPAGVVAGLFVGPCAPFSSPSPLNTALVLFHHYKTDVC